MRNLVIFIVTFCVIQSSISEPVPIDFGRCIEEEYSATRSCIINSVAINGCNKEAKICKVKRNTNSSMVIDFTPDFDSTNNDDVEWMAFALIPGTLPTGAPMPGMDPKACKYMTCPLVKTVQSTYHYGMLLPRSYPSGRFSTRFILKNAGEPRCCFTTKINVS